MRKLLAVVAVLGASAAIAPAHAQSGSLTMYGRINLSLEYIDASDGRPDVTRLSSNSSRFGIRGSEPVGGGNRLIFALESQVYPDAGSGVIAGRDSYLGFAGAWGSFRAGNMLSPYDDLYVIFGNEPTHWTSILSMSAVWAQGSLNKQDGGFNARLPNSVRYYTPNVAGLVGNVMVSLGPENGEIYILSAYGEYASGPLLAAVAYERNTKVGGRPNDWALSVAGSWNFGTFKLAGVYERLDYRTSAGPLKRDLYGATATIPWGPGSLYAAWIHAMDGKGGGSRVAGLASGPDTGADHWGVSYTYFLSKRTHAYGGFVRLANESNARYDFNINPYTFLRNGVKLNGIILGVAHDF